MRQRFNSLRIFSVNVFYGLDGNDRFASLHNKFCSDQNLPQICKAYSSMPYWLTLRRFFYGISGCLSDIFQPWEGSQLSRILSPLVFLAEVDESPCFSAIVDVRFRRAAIERFHMTSRLPCWCSKTKEWRP